MTKTARTWFNQLALLLASLLFGIFLIEATLRVLGWTFPVFMQPDANLGWSFKPNISGWRTTR